MGSRPKKEDGQFSLDLGLPPLDCLFFAALPPPAVAAHIAERAETWRRRRGLRAWPRPPGLLHVSLNGVGIYDNPPDKVVYAAMEAGSRVEMMPFEVTFDLIHSFNGGARSAFVLCSSSVHTGLSELRSAISSAMRDVGLRGRHPSSFTPHVTMLYADEVIPEVRVDKPITWTVRDFVLVRSLQGRGRHVHYRRWPLHGCTSL